MVARRLAVLPLVLALSWACSGDAGRTGVPDAGGQTWARVAVVVTAPRDVDVHVSAWAQLLRYRDLDPERAQILAGATPGMLDAPELDRCVESDERRFDDVLERLGPDAAVEMLDAGDLTFRVAGRAMTLAPRYAPDLLPIVSGPVYEAEEPIEPVTELRVDEEAFVSAFGGEDVGRFDAAALVPAVPRIQAASTDTGRVRVTWNVDTRSPEGVVIAIVSAGKELRCRTADDGAFGVEAGDVTSVAVERTARAPFAAAGLEAGELVVTARDVVMFAAE